MQPRVLRKIFLALMLATLPSAIHAQAAQQSWTAVDAALGRAGMTQADGVRRYGFPRTDLEVQLDGVAIKPALALGSWVAFEPNGRRSMVMGDLVLTPDEVNPVMSELLKGGIRVTAVHNHLLRSVPQIIYMHVMGEGDPSQLATALHVALGLSHTPLQQPAAAAAPPTLDLDTASLDRIIGRSGKANGGVYQFSIPRRERVVDAGMDVPASMGTGTAINFQPLGSGRVAVTGDFVMLASEVDPVMHALRSSGIEVTALHSHMLDEHPKLYFMHYWATGDAAKLATGLRSALDRMNLR